MHIEAENEPLGPCDVMAVQFTLWWTWRVQHLGTLSVLAAAVGLIPLSLVGLSQASLRKQSGNWLSLTGWSTQYAPFMPPERLYWAGFVTTHTVYLLVGIESSNTEGKVWKIWEVLHSVISAPRPHQPKMCLLLPLPPSASPVSLCSWCTSSPLRNYIWGDLPIVLYCHTLNTWILR